jgi:hypothetical protein
MYSKEERKKAIKPYIKYDKYAAAARTCLSEQEIISKWYKEYLETGVLLNRIHDNLSIHLNRKRLL